MKSLTGDVADPHHVTCTLLPGLVLTSSNIGRYGALSCSRSDRPAACCRVRDLNSRLKAEQKNLERTSKQASPREREPELKREMDRTAEQVGLGFSGALADDASWD